MDRIRKFANAPMWFLALRSITIATFLFITYITVRYIHQPLADFHAFRQTQTALTAYWMVNEDWTLAYQTPVVGYPWSIPYEFPIYQALVATIVSLSGFDLGAVGRFVSYAFLVACAWPAFAIGRRLNVPTTVPWVFCALLWSSPINVYWGRTFMIETAALFFSLACVPYAIDLIRHVGGWRSALLFVGFASAATLQKATTSAPILLLLLTMATGIHVRQHGLNVRALRRLLWPFVLICIPLAIGTAWARYADMVKMANLFGTRLTSNALAIWNFGTWEQKLSLATWREVVWERCLGGNARGLFGVTLLLLPWLGGREHRRFAWLSLAALVLFAVPILAFTNLHIVHDYYQVGCVAFLCAAMAIVVGGWVKEASGMMIIVPIVTLLIVLPNIKRYRAHYGIHAARELDQLESISSQSYRIGRFLREHTRPGTGLVVFGRDWNSQIGFEAQRKSITVPPSFSEYRQLWENPKAYLGGLEVGAIVVCLANTPFPTMADIQERMKSEPAWLHENVYGCEVLLARH